MSETPGRDMKEGRGIFRKTPLEKLGSPEQLNQLVAVIDMKFWIALLTLGILMAAAIAWGIFGSVEIKVSGIGMMTKDAGVLKINSMGEGVIEDFYVKTGDRVKKSQVIGHIQQKALANQITYNEKIVEGLREQCAQIKTIHDKQQNLLEKGIVSAMEFAETRQRLLSQQVSISAAEEKLQALRDQLERNSDIVSQYDGVVIEIAADKGSFVGSGAQIAIVEDEAAELDAVVYFPLADGKKIAKGMPSRIVPSVVKKEEHGFIYGNVRTVSRFPMTPQGLAKRLHNDILVRKLAELNSLYEVVVDLVEDKNSPGGYKWSSKSGAHTRIQTGTLCHAEIIIRKQRPISLVIPLFKKHLLGIGEDLYVKADHER